jgi:hypothetical protein
MDAVCILAINSKSILFFLHECVAPWRVGSKVFGTKVDVGTGGWGLG